MNWYIEATLYIIGITIINAFLIWAGGKLKPIIKEFLITYVMNSARVIE